MCVCGGGGGGGVYMCVCVCLRACFACECRSTVYLDENDFHIESCLLSNKVTH